MIVFSLFKIIMEGLELGVELQVCDCGSMEIVDYIDPNYYIVQKGKVYEVGEEE